MDYSNMLSAEARVKGRYHVIRTSFWWRVKIGDGQQTVGRCYTEVEAERLAAALRTAFLDGAFVGEPNARIAELERESAVLRAERDHARALRDAIAEIRSANAKIDC